MCDRGLSPEPGPRKREHPDLAVNMARMNPTTLTTLFLSLLLLSACERPAQPADPKLVALAEQTVMPNTTRMVNDGELVSGIYFVVDSGYGYRRHGFNHDYAQYVNTIPGLSDVIHIDPSPIVTLGNFTRIYSDKAMHGGREVRLVMDAVGSARWQVATRRSINKQLAIVVRDSVISAPVVIGEIPNGVASISLGKVSDAEVEAFTARLNAEKKDVPALR